MESPDIATAEDTVPVVSPSTGTAELSVESNVLSDDEQRKQDLAAKREARRRKILENSSNRLEKISGRPEIVDPFPARSSLPADNAIYPDPDVDRDIFETFQSAPTTLLSTAQFGTAFSGGPQMESTDFLLNALLSDLQQRAQQQHQGTGSSHDTVNQPPKPLNFYERFLSTKIQIAVVGILSYISIVTGLGKSLFSTSIFMVFLLWEMAETFLLRSRRNTNRDASGGNGFRMILMLAGINQDRIMPYMKMLQTSNRVLNDVCIFIFFFTITHMCVTQFGRVVDA